MPMWGLLVVASLLVISVLGNGCGGFVRFPAGTAPAIFKQVRVEVVDEGLVKDASPLDPNGYYFFAEELAGGSAVVRVVGPAEWAFTPATASSCGDFAFAGIKLRGHIEVKQCVSGPAGVAIGLSNGDSTVTDAAGAFVFGPLIPGAYVVQPAATSTLAFAPVSVELSWASAPVRIALKGYRVHGNVGAAGVTLTLEPLGVSVTSAEDGAFTMDDVPCGSYTLRAKHAVWQVEPESVTIDVSNGHVAVEKRFRVSKFIAHGVVTGVAGAVVELSDGQRVTTAADGSYALVLEQGQRYTLTVKRDGYVFEAAVVLAPPLAPEIAPIAPIALQLCYTSAAPVTVRLNSSSSALATGAQGCFTVSQHATYVLAPQNSSTAAYAQHTVHVTTVPPAVVELRPVVAVVRGLITCLAPPCSNIKVELNSTPPLHATTAADGTFSFESLVPAPYQVRVSQGGFCWVDGAERIVVDTRDSLAPAPVRFVQEGFQLHVDSALPLKIAVRGPTSAVSSLTAAAGANRFCLPAPGKYELTPTSGLNCFRFAPDHVTYDTAHAQRVSFAPALYLVRGSLTGANADVKLLLSGSSDATENLQRVDVDASTGAFSFYVAPDATYTLAPSSPSLLFEPAQHTVRVSPSTTCAPALSPFVSVAGVFVSGKTSPVTADLEVSIVVAGSTDAIATVRTDAAGQYRFGPLAPTQRYAVAASHPTLAVTFSDTFNIVLSPHAALTTVITDARQQPVNDILVSISSPTVQRTAHTGVDGSVTFKQLPPDTYFVRPLSKEHTFTPADQSVDVQSDQRTSFSAVRVAYSVFGTVVGLNKEPEKALSIIATPVGAGAPPTASECRTDDQGMFRLRGLSPGYSYRIRVKPSERLERASPADVVIKMANTDVTELVFVAFRGGHNKIDVCGVVNVDDAQFTSSVNVHLVDRETLVVVAATNQSTYFDFRDVPRGNYTLRINSTLSDRSHLHKQVEVQLDDAKPVWVNDKRVFVTASFAIQPRLNTGEPMPESSPIMGAMVLLTIYALYYFRGRVGEIVGNWRSGAPLLHSREKAAQAVVKPDRGQVATSFLQGTRLEKKNK